MKIMPQTGCSRRKTFRLGFTLLELLLVLLIISFLAAVSAPALWRAIDSSSERSVIEQVQLELSSQPRQAVATGTPIVLRANHFDSRIPAGYTVEIIEPIHYDFTGMSQGGRVRLRDENGRIIAEWRVVAPSGDVRRLALAQ